MIILGDPLISKFISRVSVDGLEWLNHGARVRNYFQSLLIKVGQSDSPKHYVSNSNIEIFSSAAQFHDIGKTQVPNRILNYPGALSLEDRAVIEGHAIHGESILSGFKVKNPHLYFALSAAMQMAASHHERWDGAGYPRRLISERIPLLGRIISIADMYDALTSIRAYKKAWSHTDACDQIISHSGTRFDPHIVKAFIDDRQNFLALSK